MTNKLKGYIYIMTNKTNGVLYIGVTRNINRRVYEHRESLCDGFTKKYNLTKLVYYEEYDMLVDAIAREKQLKAGSRAKKVELIEKVNKNWEDLYNKLGW